MINCGYFCAEDGTCNFCRLPEEEPSDFNMCTGVECQHGLYEETQHEEEPIDWRLAFSLP